MALSSYWQVTDEELNWARLDLQIAPSTYDKGQVETVGQAKEMSSDVLNVLQNNELGNLGQLLSTQAITHQMGEEGLEPPTSTV